MIFQPLRILIRCIDTNEVKTLSMMKNKSPKIIELRAESLVGIKSRLASCSLLEEDKSILLAIVTAYEWINGQLQIAKLTIHRLKKMFGFSTEKRTKSSEKREESELLLDLGTLGACNQEALLNALDACEPEPPVKK